MQNCATCLNSAGNSFRFKLLKSIIELYTKSLLEKVGQDDSDSDSEM